jgi:Glycosyl hydrolases family 15
MRFIFEHATDRAASASGPLQIMYGIDGRTELPERELPHLAGYLGSQPVRIGNAAAKQLQLDIYGELMDSVYLYDRWHQPISSGQWDTIISRADWLCDHWDQPDEGIWETGGGAKKFLYSQLMCWVAMERAIRLALRRGLPADLDRWRAARDAIYRRIMDRGWSASLQAFAQYEGADVLDAAVLLMPLVKFISPTDPKWLSTLDAQLRLQPRPRARLTSPLLWHRKPATTASASTQARLAERAPFQCSNLVGRSPDVDFSQRISVPTPARRAQQGPGRCRRRPGSLPGAAPRRCRGSAGYWAGS